MKKLTAKVAKRLSNRSKATHITTFQDALTIILIEAKMGKSNCFIDGTVPDLSVVRKELMSRGFRCHLEKVGTIGQPYFLSVEW